MTDVLQQSISAIEKRIRELRPHLDEHERLPIVIYPCRYSTAANSSKPLPIRSTASNLLNFKVGLDGLPSQFMAQGIKIRMAPGATFKQVIVDNTGNASPLTYTLAIGVGDITDSRITGNVNATAVQPTTVTTSQVNVTNAAGGVALAVFSATKQKATIKLRDPVNSVWVGKGDGTLTNATGFELAPGDPPLVIGGTEAINAVSTVAGGVRVDVIIEQ